jgi:hypothetical protein
MFQKGRHIERRIDDRNQIKRDCDFIDFKTTRDVRLLLLAATANNGAGLR